MSAATYDDLAEELARYVRRFGPDELRNRRRLLGFVADYMPNARRELRMVDTLHREGVIETLTNTPRERSAMETDRLIQLLEQDLGLNRELASHSVRAMAHALGLGPLPGAYADAARAAAPTPSPVTGGGRVLGLETVPVAAHSASQPIAPTEVRAAAHARSRKRGKKGKSGDFLTRIGFGNKTVGTVVATVVGCFIGLIVLGNLIGPTPEEGQQVQADSGPEAPTAADTTEYADEGRDYGIPAKATLESNLGSPTPMDIPGATRITTGQLVQMLGDANPPLVVDVLNGNHAQVLPGAAFIPVGGAPGNFGDEYQKQFESALQQVAGDKATRLVFYCAGPSCWESYNAALRARQAGYSAIYWYRGGIAAWGAAGLPMVQKPAAGQRAQRVPVTLNAGPNDNFLGSPH